MAEVKLSIIKKHTVSYIDNGALVTASVAPPSLTYLDQKSQVTISKEPIIVITYTDDTEVELEGSTRREITNTVEIEGRIERRVESYDAFKYSISGDLIRRVSNSVELSTQLERNVISFNVALEAGLRRVVTADIELEGHIQRDIRAKVELAGNLCRFVKSDEDEETGIPEKEYGSFIDKNKLFRVQHDVLDEDVSDNPYFEKQISNLKNAALLTKNQTVIKAINELVINQKELFTTTFTNIAKFDNDIGNVVNDPELREKFNALGFTNIKSAIIGLSENIDRIIDFVGSQAEELTEYEELGYQNLIDGLIKINSRIKEITYQWDDWTQDEVEWIFKTKDYIADIRDTVIDMINQMDDEVKAFEQNVEARFVQFLQDNDNNLQIYYQRIMDVINDVDDATDPEIRKVFDSYIGEGFVEDPIYRLAVEIAEDLRQYKLTVVNALTAISDELHDYSEATDIEIRKIFANLGVELGEEESFQDAITKAIVAMQEDLVDKQNEINELSANLVEHIRDFNDITEEEIRTIFKYYGIELDDDVAFEQAILDHMRAIDESLANLIQYHNDDVASIKSQLADNTNVLTILSDEVNNVDNITELEVRRIFEYLGIEYDDEDPALNIVVQLGNDLASFKDTFNTAITDLNDRLNDIEDFTEQEVRRIFAVLGVELEQEESFENIVMENIEQLKTDLINHKNHIETLINTLSDSLEGLDNLTEEEVRRVFATLGIELDEEESFKDAVLNHLDGLELAIINLTNIHNTDTADLYQNIESIKSLYKILSDEVNNVDNITELEVRRIFEYLGIEYDDEDPALNIVVQLGNELTEYKNLINTTIQNIQDYLYDNDNITEYEIRQIFSSNEIDESTTFEDLVLQHLEDLDLAIINLTNIHNRDLIELRDVIVSNISDSLELLRRSHENDISTINTRIDNLQISFTDYKTENKLTTDKLREDLESLEVKHDTDLEEIRNEITEHGNLIKDEILVSIEALQEELDGYETSNDDRLHRLETRTESLENTVQDHTSTLDDLDYRVSILEIISMFPELIADRKEELTVEDLKGTKIVSEADIESLFVKPTTLDENEISYDDTIESEEELTNNAIVSEEDIRSLFNN